MQILEEITSGEMATDTITLTYEDRFLRRKKLTSDNGTEVTIDLAHAHRFAHGQQIKGGNFVAEFRAAKEDLLEVRGDLTRLAWHIGNRHTACQIESERLLTINEPVMKKMLEGLGAEIAIVNEPFQPEQGAYHAHDH